jgi:hypothetical protein
LRSANYNSELNSALSFLTKLEFDKALPLLYKLLDKNPNDLTLINRIYSLESKRKNNTGLIKICHYIFECKSNQPEFHSLLIAAAREYLSRTKLSLVDNFSELEKMCNLVFHFSQTSFDKISQELIDFLKKNHSEDTRTPQILLHVAEHLYNNRQYLKARKELNDLMIYYTEASTQISAEKLAKKIDRLT